MAARLCQLALLSIIASNGLALPLEDVSNSTATNDTSTPTCDMSPEEDSCSTPSATPSCAHFTFVNGSTGCQKHHDRKTKDNFNFDCGFTLEPGEKDDDELILFLTYDETDWVHTEDVDDTEWDVVDNFELSCLTPDTGRNINPNQLPDHDHWTGPGKDWGTAGLQFNTRAANYDKQNFSQAAGKALYVPMAAIRTKRDDILYGSFRAQMERSSSPNYYVAFNWRSSGNAQPAQSLFGFSLPSHEDARVPTLAGSFDDQDPCSDKFQEHNDSASGWFGQQKPGMHEYRFDWLPNRVDYYVDGELVRSEADYLVDTPGSIELALWAGYQQARPETPANGTGMTLGYTKMYFNTTETDEKSGNGMWNDEKCQGWDINRRTKDIPDTQADSEGKSFFFNNQDTWNDSPVEDGEGDDSFESGAERRKFYISVAATVIMLCIAALL